MRRGESGRANVRKWQHEPEKPRTRARRNTRPGSQRHDQRHKTRSHRQRNQRRGTEKSTTFKHQPKDARKVLTHAHKNAIPTGKVRIRSEKQNWRRKHRLSTVVQPNAKRRGTSGQVPTRQRHRQAKRAGLQDSPPCSEDDTTHSQ